MQIAQRRDKRLMFFNRSVALGENRTKNRGSKF